MANRTRDLTLKQIIINELKSQMSPLRGHKGVYVIEGEYTDKSLSIIANNIISKLPNNTTYTKIKHVFNSCNTTHS